MLEQELFDYIDSSIALDGIYIGKAPAHIDYSNNTTLVITKVPSLVNANMPIRNDTVQFSVRSLYVDTISEKIDEIVNLFQGFYGELGDYQLWVVDITNLGFIYEEEDIVSGILNISFKYANQ